MKNEKAFAHSVLNPNEKILVKKIFNKYGSHIIVQLQITRQMHISHFKF